MTPSRGMAGQVGLVFALGAVGLVAACSGDDSGGGSPSGIEGGLDVVTADATDTGAADATIRDDGGLDAGGGDVTDGGGPDNVVDAGPGDPALPPDAGTVTCPITINGSLDSADGTQTARHSRIPPISVCGTTKGFPSTAADPNNSPHLYDVYRFSNPTAASVCYNFTLTYGANAVTDAGPDADSGSDASADAASPDAAGSDGGADAVGSDATDQDASADVAGPDTSADATGPDGAGDGGLATAPPKYLAAYSTFYPANLATGYLGDVGDQLTSPQTMGITVPAGGTIDVVVYAVDVAPAGVGSYTMSCATQ
jgi:hypothetical protein